MGFISVVEFWGTGRRGRGGKFLNGCLFLIVPGRKCKLSGLTGL